MPEFMPIQYDPHRHLPFAPGDTLPAPMLALMQRVRPGTGIEIIDNGDGTITLQNVCCDALPPDASTHTLTLAPLVANIVEGEPACWQVTLDRPVFGAALTVAFGLAGSEQALHRYPLPMLTFQVGEQTHTVCVTTTDDALPEPTHTLVLQPVFGGRLTGWTPPGDRIDTILVRDNDGEAGNDSSHQIVSIVPVTTPIIEGGHACWDITLDQTVQGSDLSIVLTLAGDEQTIHNLQPPPLTIPIGQVSARVCIATLDDAVFEPERTLVLGALTSVRITGVPAATTIVVQDNDIRIGLPATLGTAEGGCCGSDADFPSYAISFEPDGRVQEFGCAGTQGEIGRWFDGPLTTPGAYAVRLRDATPLALGYGPVETWLLLDQARLFQWEAGDGVTTVGTPASRFARGTFELRRNDTGEVLSSSHVFGPQLLHGNECP